MKIRWMLAALASCLFTAATAQAGVVSFVVTTQTTGNRPLNGLQVGDTVTFNIRLAKSDATTGIFAVGGAVQLYNPTILRFDSGAIGLDTTFFATNAARTNGLGNAIDASLPLVEGDVPGFGRFVQIINAVSTTGKAGDGSLDMGIDGVVGGGDAQFRLVFTALQNGDTTVEVGTTTNITLGNVIGLAGGAQDQAVTTLNIRVPEPGVAGAGIAAFGSAIAMAGIRRRMAI